MQFGIFDHIDARGEPLAPFYEDRLTFIRAAEAAGFYSYHMAEHHQTPLGMTPSPNVFMAAMARETTRIRMGPLIYMLPLYHPLRLIDEICMVDQLSNGRLDIGIGRGISPYEVAYYGVEPDATRDMSEEFMDILLKGLTSKSLSHDGKYHQFTDVPMELEPLQKPYPPLWYGAGNEHGARFSAQNGMNVVTLGATERVAGLVSLYSDMWEEAKDQPRRKNGPVTDPLVGVSRHMFIAETDAEAERLARPAYAHWYSSLVKLWQIHGTPPVTGMIIADYDEACEKGVCVVGTASAVLDKLSAQLDQLGAINYLVCQLAWGCLTHEQEMHSLDMFTTEVMPALADR